MKILVTGSQSQIGKSLSSIRSSYPNFKFIFLTKLEFDITSTECFNTIDNYSPNYIINTAAYTKVDQAENNQSQCYELNTKACEILASISKKKKIPLIHISTDYVFDGTAKTPYLENDPTCPINVYGKSKTMGENIIIKELQNYIILRTSWIFSEYNSNFLKTMFQLRNKEELSIIHDQMGAPTYSLDIAKAIMSLIEHSKENKNIWGLYHYSGKNYCSWYDFSKVIFQEIDTFFTEKFSRTLKPILAKDYPTLATRPYYSCLNNTKIKKLGIQPSNWQKGVQLCIQSLAKIK